MGSIPLPALAVRPPEQPDMMGNFSKLIAMKQMMGQQQIQQQALQTGQLENQQRKYELGATQATNQAYQDAVTIGSDGKPSFDTDALAQHLSSAGYGSKVPAILKTITEYDKSRTDLTEAMQKVQVNSRDTLGALGSALQKANYDPSLAQTLLQHSLQDPSLQPQAKSQLLQMQQQITANPGAVKQLADTFVTQSPKYSELAIQDRQAHARELAAQTSSEHLQAEMPGGPLSAGSQAAQRMPYEIAKDVAVAKQTQPLKIQTAVAEAQAKSALEQMVARGSNAALAQVPPHLIAPATAAAEKAGSEFAQAQSVTQRIQAMMDATKKGNVVSYQLLPEEGALQMVTAQGIHRINMAEIANYGGGSLWQRLQGHIGKQISGKSIPDSVLSDMGDIQKLMSEGSTTKYENTLKAINQNYSSTFKPVSMGQKEKAGNDPLGIR